MSFTELALHIVTISILKLQLISHSFDIEAVNTLSLTVAITLVDALTTQFKGFLVGQRIELRSCNPRTIFCCVGERNHLSKIRLSLLGCASRLRIRPLNPLREAVSQVFKDVFMKVDHGEVSAHPEQARQKESLIETCYSIVYLLLPDALIKLKHGYFLRYIVHAILPTSLVW